MIQVQLKRSKKLRLETKLKAAFERMEDSYVTVGIHDDAGSYPAVGGKDAPTVAEVANWLEKGTETMPARPFMQSTVDENRELLTRLMDRAVINIGWNKWTVEKALARVGSQWLRAVQNKVKSNVAPPLGHSPGSQRYLAKKLALGQPGRTLIATGKLLGSLAYKVVLKGAAVAESARAAAEVAASETPAKTGNAERRAAARADGAAMKAAAKAARSAFSTDKAKQERFKAQQATKHHKV